MGNSEAIYFQNNTLSVTGYHPPISKCPPPPPSIIRISRFLKFPISSPYQQMPNLNTIHVKQQSSVGFLIFKFTLKYMLGNVYINK